MKSHLQFDEASIEVSKHIGDGKRFDQYFSLSDAEQVDYYLVPYTDSENRTPQNGILERHEVFKDRRLCSMSHMLHISKSRRDILFLRKHSTRHYRRRSRRRQSNESTVDLSFASLDVTI